MQDTAQAATMMVGTLALAKGVVATTTTEVLF
jgi:hypothetical protein